MKEPILKKSCDLFLRFGYKSVTMDDIANALCMSKKTLYKCFKNKKDLVNESAFFLHKEIKDELGAIYAKKLNPIAENFEMNVVFKRIFCQTAMSPMNQLNKHYPITYEKLIDGEFEVFKKYVTNNIKRGIKSGLYRDDLDIESMFRYYFILVTNLQDHPMFKNDEKLKKGFPVLEYHTRAIATEKGLIELENQLQTKNNNEI